MSIEAAPRPAPDDPRTTLETRRRAAGLLAATVPPLVVALVLLLRFWTTLTVSYSRVDENEYLKGFNAARAGRSPYTIAGYLYPPAFAVLGGHAIDRFGLLNVRTAMRTAGVVGAAVTVWLAASVVPWSASRRLVLALAIALAAPGVALCLRTGNVSPIVTALVLGALLAWPRAPVSAGLFSAASLAVKPLGVLVAPLLAVHRPAAGGRRHWIAAAVAVVATAALTLALGGEYLRDFLEFGATLASEDARVNRTVSLHRFLLSLGLPVGRLPVAALVAVGSVVLVRARPLDSTQLACFVIAASCLATPALWTHALLMTLPIQILAVRRALRRRDEFTRPGSRRRFRVYELAGVVLAVVGLHFSDKVGGVDPHPSLGLAAALLPLVFAPPVLTWYILRVADAADGASRPT